MAKGNKRQRKKQQKRVLQAQVRPLIKDTGKEVKNLSFDTLLSIARQEEERQRKQEEKRQQRLARKRENVKKNRGIKADYLNSLGIDISQLTAKQIDSIKLKDIQNNSVNEKNYPNIFKHSIIDYNKPYTLPDNKRLYFAFRDFAGEHSIEELLNDLSELSNEELMKRLEQIVNAPQTYQKGIKGTSSGKAGDYKYAFAEQDVIAIFNKETYDKTRRTKYKEHTGQFKGFQVLHDGKRVSFDTVTLRGILIIANAFMYNITEVDRDLFYNRLYSDLKDSVPDMAKHLPKPK